MNIIENNLKFRNDMDIRKTTKGIILHHAAATTCTIEDIHTWHLNNGWAGVGYHFFVRKDGSIYRGRPENTVGVHCPGANSESVGICAEGNFQNETMPEVQKNAIIELIAYIKSKYVIEYVRKHSYYVATSCPGKNYPFEEIVNGQATVNTNTQGLVAQWQSIMNTCYACGLAVDNSFGPDSTAKANKYYLRYKSPVTVNEHVRFIQKRLNAFGYNLAEDGSFGPTTSNAVKQFQKAYRLVVDGYVGANTTKKLLNL